MTRRHVVALSIVWATWPLLACGQARASNDSAAQQAVTAYRAGNYRDAITRATEALARDSLDASSAVIALRALRDVGRLAQAESLGAQVMRRPAVSRFVALPYGYVLEAMGRLDPAASAYAVAVRGPDSLRARYEIARLGYERGDHQAALQALNRFIDVYNGGGRATLSASDLRAVALACRTLGVDDPQLFKDALRAFDQGIAKDPTELEGHVELATMLLDKFNSALARGALEAVLAVNPHHPRALVAMSRLLAFDGSPKATEPLARALELNAGDPAARAMSAMRLVDVERYADAEAEARLGLAQDSTAPAPWTVIAAARYLAGDSAGHHLALATAHRRLTGSALAEVTLADVASRSRLYREAAAFAQAGVARDRKAGRALALLGINQLRIGRMADGTKNLTDAFARDPYDVWAKNTLDLLDTFKDYTELTSPRFVLSVETKDAELMALFAVPLAEEAFDSLAARYAFRPTPPVRVEFFRSHADFSVRTVGLAGLGALGVSFGNVIAMDSPLARAVGEFNWGSTLWHELTHTFTLGVTENRVPRWISEGLSVYEERRARPSWGSDVSPDLIAAYKAGRLHPVSRLNDGFVRPRYGQEVVLSYALASYVFEMMEQQHGIAGIRKLLDAYRRERTTAQAFSEVLGRDISAYDATFDAWFRQRFAREFASIDPRKAAEADDDVEWDGALRDTMTAAMALVASKSADAVPTLERARDLFPAFVQRGSAYHLLATLHLARGESVKAAAALSSITARNESAFEENLQLARLLETSGNMRGAVQAYERTLFITPFNAAVHDSLAAAAARVGDHARVIRSRKALLALAPSDRVEALYQLAKAFAAAGDATAARREILRALDLAPNFEKAQALLLALPRSGDGL